MAYVLGYLYADGCLIDNEYIRAKYVQVSSIDRPLINAVRLSLNAAHPLTRTAPHWPGGKMQYRLRIGSHRLYQDLIHLGLYPNKSLTIAFPAVPPDHLGSFIRGYFDGDGTVTIAHGPGKTRARILKGLRIIFTSGSKKFLEELQQEMRSVLGVDGGWVMNSHRSFQLMYNTRPSIHLFTQMYAHVQKSLFLERKFKKFVEYLRLRPKRVDDTVHRILCSLDHGHVVK